MLRHGTVRDRATGYLYLLMSGITVAFLDALVIERCIRRYGAGTAATSKKSGDTGKSCCQTSEGTFMCSDRGGSVIMMQLENEFGFYGD